MALDARRAAEVAPGTVCWLRPGFQDPAKRASKSSQKQEQSAIEIQANDGHLHDEIAFQNHSDLRLPTLLQTLHVLGRAHPVESPDGRAWRG